MRQKTGNVPSELLFVNKNAGSGKLTQSHGSEKSEILRHVQLNSRHADAPDPNSWHVFQSPADWSSARSLDNRPNKGCALQPKVHRPFKQSKSKKRAEETCSPHRTSSKVSPLRRVDSPSGDLSNSHEITIAPRVQYLFGVYTSDISPLLFPIETVAAPSQKYTLTMALEDPLMRHSLLSLVSTKMHSSTHSNLHHVLATAFKHKALSHLRELISNSTGKPLTMSQCYAISMLTWIECIVGNMGDLKAHASGLQHLLPRANDLDTIPAYILRIIYACSYLCAAFLDVPPTIQPARLSDESQLSREAQAILKAPQLSDHNADGHLFFLLSTLKTLGSTLTPVVVEFQRVVLLRHMLAKDQSGAKDADIRYVCMKEAFIERELLLLGSDVSMNPCQHAVRRALFIFSALPVMAATGPSAALSRTLAKQMRQTLEQTDLSNHWRPCPGLLLWVLVNGAFICRGEAEWPWFQAQVLPLIDVLEFTSVSDMEAILRGYCYASYLQDTVEIIWREYECLEWLHDVDTFGELPLPLSA